MFCASSHVLHQVLATDATGTKSGLLLVNKMPYFFLSPKGVELYPMPSGMSKAMEYLDDWGKKDPKRD